MKFIDLFAGLGGFHVALEKLGHECVFASEIKKGLGDLYSKNFGLLPCGDIRSVSSSDIPAHDILCAGFPCQPFSKAGMQKGLEDENNGDLFHEILRILRYRRPTYFILANVQHLKRHDNRETYGYMALRLKSLGYDVQGEVLSPHDFNIPQHRQRLFIVGSLNGLGKFKWPERIELRNDTKSILDPNPKNAVKLENEKRKCLDLWQRFLDAIPKSDKLPGFPIWSMEFGATYPFENETPLRISTKKLASFRGAFGASLSKISRIEMLSKLPSYSKTDDKEFPRWKKSYIRNNREFYREHKSRLKPIIGELAALSVPSWQKLEWNVQNGVRNINNYIIQFRGSGIRLKRPDFFPSLVCVSTQIPIVGWERRYITRQEGARLQGLDSLNFLPDNNGSCFDALGNAVNATLVRLIAKNLVGTKRNKGHRSKHFVNNLTHETV
jgi:DNA (cytosine-5)-methyltransferase 1